MDWPDRYHRAQLLLTDGHARANAEHRAIADACAKGKISVAEALILQHVRGAHADLSK